jgi:nucleotide-binding universal stress UspA family protein
MRAVAAYDGSVQGDGVLYDLAQAGLPARSRLLVLTAAPPWAPYGPGGDPAAEAWSSASMAAAREYTRRVLRDAKAVADRGARFLEERHPGWKVRAESIADDPSHAILSRSEAWKAHLVVLGTHNRSAVARFLMGSVSQRVLHHAHADVRISRPRLESRWSGGLTLILGMDGSQGAMEALHSLCRRDWPEETEVRVVAAVEPRAALADIEAREDAAARSPVARKGMMRKQALSWLERKVEDACGCLARSGLRAVPSIIAGDPRRVLLKEAGDWRAHALFLGSRGRNPVERFLIGSVSSAVAAHAPCSVEVVRQRNRTMSAR